MDLGLTAKGENEAHAVGRSFRQEGLSFRHVFVSALGRTMETARLLASELERVPDDFYVSAALNERDYGELAGLNKDEARQRWGDEQVRVWRRSYATAPHLGFRGRAVVEHGLCPERNAQGGEYGGGLCRHDGRGGNR